MRVVVADACSDAAAALALIVLTLLPAVPYMPGGSKFMRNAPVPLEAIFPHGA